MQLTIVDAFTKTPGEGNRAGVVLDAAGLDAEAMQRIAAVVGASETAFLLSPPGEGPIRLRYFTPTDEIDFCGHATVATFVLLLRPGVSDWFRQGGPPGGRVQDRHGWPPPTGAPLPPPKEPAPPPGSTPPDRPTGKPPVW